MMTLNATTLYTKMAAGSATGGAVLSHWGLLALGYAGATVAAMAVLHLVVSERLARRNGA